MNARQRQRAAHTITCFMVGAPVCPNHEVQRVTITMYTPMNQMLNTIYKKQRDPIYKIPNYDSVATLCKQ